MLNPYIKTFIKVAECGSFTSASEQLYTSKVSVMNQINSLEKRVGVPLFERTHHGVALTEAGKLFYKNALQIIGISEKAIREARQIGGAVSKIIRVGTSIMRPCNSLVELWDNINTVDKEYQFNIVPFNDDVDSLSAMLNGLGSTIDCFVTPCGSMNLLMNYNFLPLKNCKCAVAMSKKHRLAKRKILDWKDIEHESLLLIKRGDSYILDEMRDDILRDHKSINIIDFNGYYDISAFNLCEQHGYLMETLDMWAGLHPSLVTIPVKWSYEIPYGILYAKEPSESVKEFIDIIENSGSAAFH
ncbi:MAG: LysR family transcriptional regulator [Oscillospiraceae bacterium]|nr:LysR family transcriptional regulator [Oscillospiraceae bacterium]